MIKLYNFIKKEYEKLSIPHKSFKRPAPESRLEAIQKTNPMGTMRNISAGRMPCRAALNTSLLRGVYLSVSEFGKKLPQ